MVSNNATITLFLIISVAIPVVFTTSTPKTGLLNKVISWIKKPAFGSKPRKNTTVLQDSTNKIEDVQPVESVMMNAPQKQLPLQVNEEFEKLIKQGKYNEIFAFDKNMDKYEFMKQLCAVVKTPEQYRGIAKYLRDRSMVSAFYLHGDLEVVKGAIIGSRVYLDEHYAHYGRLEDALSLALEEGNYDRFIGLLDVRKGLNAEKDERRKRKGKATSFEIFMFWFLYNLAPWANGMSLKRFLTFRGDECRGKYPEIFDNFCQELVSILKIRVDNYLYAENSLVGFIGQPSLLTPEPFVRGSLSSNDDAHRSFLIKYGWREAIAEGLKKEYPEGGEKFWRVMKGERPDQFQEEFPETEEERIVVCKHFPTKQELEGRWADKSAPILFYKLKILEFTFDPLPDVLWLIIFSYAITWLDTDSLAIPTE